MEYKDLFFSKFSDHRIKFTKLIMCFGNFCNFCGIDKLYKLYLIEIFFLLNILFEFIYLL